MSLAIPTWNGAFFLIKWAKIGTGFVHIWIFLAVLGIELGALCLLGKHDTSPFTF
jgi:hypothetical protein